MIDLYPNVLAATERHQLIVSRLTLLWEEVGRLAARLADLRLYREGPEDSLEAETERLLQMVSKPGRLAEREEVEQRLGTLRSNIRTLEFAEQKALLAVHAARRVAAAERLREADVIARVRDIYTAAVALSGAHQRGQELAQRLQAEGVGVESLYWLSHVGWSDSVVDAWRRTAERTSGAPLPDLK